MSSLHLPHLLLLAGPPAWLLAARTGVPEGMKRRMVRETERRLAGTKQVRLVPPCNGTPTVAGFGFSSLGNFD
ncbi:MAG: hypothetical protein K2X93_12840 [Candidatus Obscuribacterales bacterium]|nr:hypothetical protein [Candidatus Obscuribacterales bacterium]